MIDDMELHPFTIHAVRKFRDGNDPSKGDFEMDRLASELCDEIIELDDVDKGQVIIDLLTLLDVMRQAVSIMQVQAIEEASR